jgi:hypothetical protein
MFLISLIFLRENSHFEIFPTPSHCAFTSSNFATAISQLSHQLCHEFVDNFRVEVTKIFLLTTFSTRRHEEISFYLFPSFESCVFGHKQKMAMKNFLHTKLFPPISPAISIVDSTFHFSPKFSIFPNIRKSLVA